MKSQAALSTCVLSVGLLAGCGGAEPPAMDPVELSNVAEDATAPWPPWTVRGRWESPVDLTVAVDDRGGPLAEGVLLTAVEQACEAWSASGFVRLRPAASVESPDFHVRWGLAEGGRRSPFAARPGVALTGAVERGTTVQLDPSRSWWVARESGTKGAGADREGPYLVATIAHELGHVLGLGHTERMDTLLSPRIDQSLEEPTAADLAALASMYGPEDAPTGSGDLLIVASGSSTSVAPPLKGLATRGRSAFGLGDADADGDDELFVWRTDHEGHGSLVILDFDAGPRVSSTFGPMMGLVPPGAQAGPVRAADGSSLFLVVRPEDAWLAYSLSTTDGLSSFAGPVLELEGLPGDADGDGVLDLSSPETRELFERGLQRRIGDLDGDGRIEEIRVVR